jgi:hypothetical protein
MTKNTSEVKTGGSKAVSNVWHTPFGDSIIKVRAKGYKSSEGDKVYKKPEDKS